jgi:outer membrane protein assembly factor BamB
VHPPFRTRWSVRTSLVEFPPVVAYGRVFYAQQHGSLIARDAATGVIVWAREFHHCSAASPVVVAGVIYHAFMGPRCNKDRNARGMIVAVDAMTGKTLWTVTTPIVESSLVHVNGLLYYGAWDSRVYALSTVTHRVAWSRRVDSAITDSVAYHAGRVFIGTDRGGFYGLNAANGRVVWQTSSFSRFGAREYFYATPTVAYGRVYAANTDGYVYSFGERDGRLIWAKHVGSYVYSAPAVFQRRIYVGTFSGQLVALDAATGDILWHFNASSAIAGAPSIVDGVIYFSTLPGEHRGAQRPIKAGPARSYGVDLATHRAIWQSSTGRYSPVVADATSIYFVGAYRLSALEPGP